MTITTLPTASAIRTESRLTPSQVSTAFANTSALETDIAARITTYRAVVEKKLSGVGTSEANQTIATEALQLRVLASLFSTAGYLNDAYSDKAQQLMAQFNDLIDDLTGTSPDVPGNVSGTVTATRTDGYSCNGTEYTSC